MSKRLNSVRLSALGLACHLVLSSTLCSQTTTLPPADPGEEESTPEITTPGPDREIVVTATRTKTKISDTASSLTVVSRQDIEAQQDRTVVDALQEVPGLDLASSGAPGQVTGVFMRGLNTDHTSVLLDGRKLPYDLAGGYNFGNLSITGLEQIEVLRGPSASLYGGNTIGGAINMITRDGRGESPNHDVWFEAGSYNTTREGAGSRGQVGIFNYGVDISRTDTDWQRTNNEYRQSNVISNFGVQLNEDIHANLLALYQLSDSGTPGSRFSNDPNDNLLWETWLLSPGVTWQTTDYWTQSAYYTHSQQRLVFTGGTPFSFNVDGRIQVDNDRFTYQSDFEIASNWSLSVGTDLEDVRYYRNNDPGFVFFTPGVDIDENRTSVGTFIATQWTPVEKWNINGSARLDHHSDYGNPVTWRVGSSYTLPEINTLVHASTGTAYAPPSPQNSAAATFGNPQIEPEHSFGWEAGVDQPFWQERIHAYGTYFYNDVDDLILFNPGSFTIENIGKARTEGVEAGLRFDSITQLSLNLNYTYLNADNLSNGTRLVRRPRHSVNFGITGRPHSKVTLFLGGSYVADREDFIGASQGDAEDYFLMRLAASWQAQEHLKIFARVENLTNDQYEAAYGFPALDQAAYAGLKVTF